MTRTAAVKKATEKQAAKVEAAMTLLDLSEQDLLKRQQDTVSALSDVNAEIRRREEERKAKARQLRDDQVMAFLSLPAPAYQIAVDLIAPRHTKRGACQGDDSKPTDDVSYTSGHPASCARCFLLYGKEYGYLNYVHFPDLTLYTEDT